MKHKARVFLLFLLSLIITSFLAALIPRLSAIEATYEQYTEANISGAVGDVNYWSQTFTTIAQPHNVSTIWLKMYRYLYPGTVTVKLQGVDGSGAPNGTTLWLDGRNASLFTADTAGIWYNFTDTPTPLLASTQYAIVVDASGSGLSACVMWLGGYPGNYSGGHSWFSTDSGASWSSYSSGVHDFTFKICSEVIPETFGITYKAPNMWTASYVDGGSGMSIYGASYWLLSQNVNVTNISVYLNGSGTNAQAQVALYNMSLYPIETTTPQNITTEGWYNYTIASSTLLSAGQYELLLYTWCPNVGNRVSFYFEDGATYWPASYCFVNQTTNWPTWPNPVVSPTGGAFVMSIYANYTFEVETPVTSASPTTIGLVNTPWAIRYQPKVFFGAGRYWAFFVNMTYPYSGPAYGSGNSTNASFTSTANNGVTWETPTDLGFVLEPAAENLQIVWNGTQVTVIRRTGAVLMTRMGTPETNGTITWLGAWYDTFTAGGISNCDYFACLASDGKLWISWEYGPALAQNSVWALNCTYTAGAWTNTTAPLLVESWATTTTLTNSFIVSLGDGFLYDVYWAGTIGTGIYGKLWNGTAWGVQETVSTEIAYSQYSLGYETWTRGVEVDNASNIYYVFLDHDLSLDYVKRTNATGTWSATEYVHRNVLPFCSPSLSLYGNILYLFYAADKNGISYRTMVAGTWSARALFLDEYVDLIPTVSPLYNFFSHGGYDGRINPFTQVAGTNFAILYLTNSTLDNYYKLKFLILATSSLPLWPVSTAWYIVYAPNATDAGAVCRFSSYRHDPVGLSGYFFSTNNTGTWINDTWTAMAGTDAWANATHVLNTTIGISVSYLWYTNNSLGLWNTTLTYNLITTDPALTHPIYVPWSIPYYVPLLGKGIALIVCFGAVALVFSNTKSMKEALKAAVITLLVGIVFLVIWFVMTSLEAYA